MKKVTVTFAAILFFLGTAIAQDDNSAKHNVSIDIPTIAILDIEDADGEAASISLEPNIDVLEAGDAVSFTGATDNSLWLNYTSVVTDGATRTVSAKISSGASTLPEGISLVLSVAGASNGKGTLGTAVSGDITLGASNETIVNNIGSCYTENGATNGHNLTYKVAMDNDEFASLVATNYTVEVTYTITDN
ncbi:MAG TPA: hypothetical protein VKA10_07845 [Prolixibacteraceae bacterium]|nr:hypothetical protein [Prolixibacteraceae bacterium]